MPDRFWVGGSGIWDNASTANWSATSGGAAGASAPTTADTATFDANSGTSAVVTASATATASNVTINKSDLNLSLNGSPTFVGALTLTTGILTLNSYALTCSVINFSNSNARTINFGTGKIVVTGSGAGLVQGGAVTNLTVTGIPVVDVNNNSSIASTVGVGALSEEQSFSFNFTTGTYTLTFLSVSSRTANNVNFTGFSGTWGAIGAVTIYGNLILSPTMSLTASNNALTFGATTSTKTITSNGRTMDFPVTFNGVGGTWKLIDNFTLGSTRAVTLTNGTLDGNGQNVSIGSFALGSGAKTLTLGSGTWTVLGANWNANTNVANLTVSPSVGIVNMTSASAKTFAGGAKTWPTLNQGGAGTLTIQQSNTFTNITNTVQPATITLTSGTTQTVTDFDVSGTSGNLITLNASTPGSRATLTDSGDVNSVSFVDIKDIAATGYGEWQAYTSNGNVNSGNNVGWVFDAPPAFVASEYPPELRSFTEKRRF